MPYSKFCQYAYFIDGIHPRFAPIKKFLEQEFTSSHDRMNNIPISLELHNLPATITSLAVTHGISVGMASGQVQQVPILNEGHSNESDIDFIIQESINQVNSKLHEKANPVVQCWFCDENHPFHQCTQLKRLHSVCAQRPNVAKYLHQISSKRTDSKIKMLSIKAVLASFPEDDEDEILCEVIDNASAAGGNESGDITPSKDEKIQSLVMDEFDSTTNLECAISHDLLFHKSIFEEDDLYSDYIRMLQFENATNIDEAIRSIPSSQDIDLQFDLKYHAQIDSGTDRTTTADRCFIHDFRLPDPTCGDHTHIGDAGQHSHDILGYGYIHIRSYDIKTGDIKTLCVSCHVPVC
jgi:hypothetical protein